ncbi:MAG TPA: MoaD/ThiS family protein [Candidatus Binatia bacterium]|nr:MoaD/ThiS family protein [Candidatus Binatia bacterium]
MSLTVKFIGALRHLSGKTQFSITFQDGISIKELLNKINQEMPKLKRTFTDQELNDSRSNSLILVNGGEISVLNGYETKLREGDEIVFVPVVHGG